MAAGGHRGAVTMAKGSTLTGASFSVFVGLFLFQLLQLGTGIRFSAWSWSLAVQRRQLALQLRRHRAAVDTVAAGHGDHGQHRHRTAGDEGPAFFTSSLRRVFTAAGFLPGRGATSISIWGNFFSSMLLSHPPVSGRSGPPRISASIIPDGPPRRSTDRRDRGTYTGLRARPAKLNTGGLSWQLSPTRQR